MNSSLLVALTLSLGSPADPAPDYTPRLALEIQVTQQKSSKCVTPQTICIVDELLVGSPCFCDRFAGVVLP